jgi:23S rRNA-/tRNA-specific pseudouridylate synthase
LPSETLNRLHIDFQDQLPEYPGLEDYLQALLPSLRHHSEDLNEAEFFLEKPWQEITDEEGVFQSILHFFNAEGEYLKSIEGNVLKGSWRQMPKGSNKLMIDISEKQQVVKSELYDLVYLDEDFMVLKKNASALHQQGKKFLFLAYETHHANASWKTAVERLYSSYKGNTGSNSWLLYLVILIVLFMLVYSFF